MTQGVQLRSDPYRHAAQLPVQVVQLLYDSDGTDNTNPLSALNVDDVSDDPECAEELKKAEKLLKQGEKNLISLKEQMPTLRERIGTIVTTLAASLVILVYRPRNEKMMSVVGLSTWYCFKWLYLVDLDNATERKTWQAAAKTAKLVDFPGLTKGKYVFHGYKIQSMTMKDVIRYDLCDPNVKRGHKPAFYVCMDKLIQIATLVSGAHDRNVANIRKDFVDGMRMIKERDKLLAQANEQFSKANKVIEHQFIVIKNQKQILKAS